MKMQFRIEEGKLGTYYGVWYFVITIVMISNRFDDNTLPLLRFICNVIRKLGDNNSIAKTKLLSESDVCTVCTISSFDGARTNFKIYIMICDLLGFLNSSLFSAWLSVLWRSPRATPYSRPNIIMYNCIGKKTKHYTITYVTQRRNAGCILISKTGFPYFSAG